jgi:archaellum component FlaG (FlaF/FlaG flagellin family)
MKMKLIISTFSLLFTLSLISQNYYVKEDFNGGGLPTGWTNTAVTGSQVWNFGIDGATSSSNNKFTSGNQNINGTPLAYFDDDTLGLSSTNNFARLATTVFDNSNDSLSFLEFDYNFKNNAAINDSFYVEIFDGSKWEKIFTKTTDDCGHYTTYCLTNGFPHAKIDISNYKNTNCQVRFTYFDGNDWGWYAGIDNVKIYAPYENDLSVSTLVSPISRCGLGAQDSVSIWIKNLGLQTVSNFSVGYQLNGQSPILETITDSIKYLDSLQYTFKTTANFSSVATYNLSLYTALGQEQDRTNDTLKAFITNDSLFNLLYHEDFETTSHGWRVSGVNSSWERGIPNNNFIDTAASGKNAFITNLNGNYNSEEFSFVTSPCFNFSILNDTAFLFFNLFYNTENSYDQAWLEYSTNFGKNWKKLSSGSRSMNYYNHPNNQSWSNSSQKWLTVVNSLDSLIGEPSVKFRLVFNSDLNKSFEGIGFDNFNIITRSQNDLQLEELVSPVTSQLPICNYDSNSIISVKIRNLGNRLNSSFIINYQVDGGPVISETVNSQLNSFESKIYSFNTTYDFIQKDYDISVWLTSNNDNNNLNDSLLNLKLYNTSPPTPLSLPISEDFEASIAGINDSLISTWSRSGGIKWLVADTVLTNLTGPNQDHTPNGKNFLYLETKNGNTNNSGYLSSSCFTVNDYKTEISYWYHKYGAEMGDLLFEINDGKIWQSIDTIVGQTHNNGNDPYLNKKVTIPSTFKGRNVKLRFRGLNGIGEKGYMAIDDISITQKFKQDAKIESIKSPVRICYVDSFRNVSVLIRNLGDSIIQKDSLSIHYQVDQGNVITDTLTQDLQVGDTITFTFKDSILLSQANPLGILRIWTELNGDKNVYNDSALLDLKTLFPQGNLELGDLEVESINCLLLSGWDTTLQSQNNLNATKWLINSGTTPSRFTSIGGTGPTVDHTLGTDEGRYIYLEASSISRKASFTTNEVDLTNYQTPYLSFWYHMYGSQMGSLYIDIYDVANNIWYHHYDSLIGQSQKNSTNLWLEKTINLSQLNSTSIKIRFTGIKLMPGFNYEHSDMAVDDISIYDSSVTTSVKAKGNEVNLILYPNPSSGKYFIESSENLSGFEYQILDLHGRTVQRSVIKANQTSFDLSNNTEGIYFLVIPELNVKEKLVKY